MHYTLLVSNTITYNTSNIIIILMHHFYILHYSITLQGHPNHLRGDPQEEAGPAPSTYG